MFIVDQLFTFVCTEPLDVQIIQHHCITCSTEFKFLIEIALTTLGISFLYLLCNIRLCYCFEGFSSTNPMMQIA